MQPKGMDESAVSNMALGLVKEDQPDPDKETGIKTFTQAKMQAIRSALAGDDTADLLAGLGPNLPSKRACHGR